jgi:hypothetical protein
MTTEFPLNEQLPVWHRIKTAQNKTVLSIITQSTRSLKSLKELISIPSNSEI